MLEHPPSQKSSIYLLLIDLCLLKNPIKRIYLLNFFSISISLCGKSPLQTFPVINISVCIAHVFKLISNIKCVDFIIQNYSQSTRDMLQGDNYSWEGVLHFLHKQHESHAQQENIWFLEKKGLNEQIKELEARVAALQNINNDLLNRNKMLEYCLRKMKGQNKIEENKIEEMPKIPERRPKPNKNHINKVLQSLGIRNLIENIQKDLEMRGQSALKLQDKVGTAREKDKSVVAMKSTIYKQTHTLTGHQDGVRDLLFYNEKNFLISASEDCTLRVWSLADSSAPQCIGAIREHSGPIFTVVQAQNYVFTGGMEGVIRGWDFRNVSEKKDLGKKNLVATWNNSQQQKLEPIWQLLYSPENKMLFSTSSESSIKSYSLSFEEDKVHSAFKRYYSFHPVGYSSEDEDIPTSICIHNGKLVSGYVNNHSLVQFDLQTGKVVQQLKFPTTSQFSTNKVVSHPNLIIAAYEDKMVRLFDDSKMTFSFKAHDDSVMSIAVTSNLNQFFTCGHDGYVKIWDLRKLEPISSFNAHSKKYDESVHCVATSDKFKAASGGADSLIKVFEANA